MQHKSHRECQVSQPILHQYPPLTNPSILNPYFYPPLTSPAAHHVTGAVAHLTYGGDNNHIMTFPFPFPPHSSDRSPSNQPIRSTRPPSLSERAIPTSTHTRKKGRFEGVRRRAKRGCKRANFLRYATKPLSLHSHSLSSLCPP